MPMEEEDDQFDSTLLEAAMSLAASKGWGSLSMPEIARHAGLDVGEVRCRYPFKTSVLLLLGQLADRSALIDDGSLGTSREMLFDLMMRRFDVFQQYRPGVLSVLKTLPFDPLVTIILGGATVDSMRWIAGAAGIQTSGIEGALRVQGVVALWTYALRSWEKDDSEDLGLTMIALESGLDRAERMGLFRNAVALKSETDGDETSNLLTSEAGDASFNDFQDGK